LDRTTEIPDYPESRFLTLEDKKLLTGLFKETQPQISEFTFTNLFVWNDSEPVRLSRLRQSLLVQRRRQRDGRILLLPPIGTRPLLGAVRDLKASSKNQTVPPLYGISREQTRELADEAAQVESDRDNWDYVYLTSDLADLPGDKYHPKRNFISRCLSGHKCDYAEIDPSVVKDCLQLQTQWCSLRNCSLVSSLEAENRAIKTAFDNFEALSIFGGAIYVDGKLEAFTLSEPLNRDTAVIHFEKANPEIVGLYQVINQRFCQNSLRSFRFVNREQDLGIMGLRKAKLSYYPHHMVEKYIAYLT
jgi:hypothetical protein